MLEPNATYLIRFITKATKTKAQSGCDHFLGSGKRSRSMCRGQNLKFATVPERFPTVCATLRATESLRTNVQERSIKVLRETFFIGNFTTDLSNQTFIDD
jgi:hypothetical protein